MATAEQIPSRPAMTVPPPPKPPVHRVIIVLSLLAIVSVAALVAGVVLGAKYGAPKVSYEIKTEVPEEVDGVETPVDTNDGAAEEPAVTGDLEIVWRSPDEQDERPVNFYFRAWWESQRNDGEAAPDGYSAKILGDFSSGKYAGKYLVEETAKPAGLGETEDRYLVIEEQKSDTDPVILSRYRMLGGAPFNTANMFESVEGSAFAGVHFSDELIPELTYASTVKSQDGKSEFRFLGKGGLLERITLADYLVAVTLQDGTKLYADNGKSVDGFYFMPNEFLARSVDGRALWYDINVPFYLVTEDTQKPAELSLVWNDGTTNTEVYFKAAQGGCGFSSQTNVVINVPELVEGGHLAGGAKEVVFVPKNYEDPIMPMDEFRNWKYSHEGGVMADFIKTHPYFFYKDSLGRWVKFTNISAMSAAECGKPVIYLYPEKTTDLTVNLAPQGGFTKTEPAYGNGWNVTASPDGTLVNKADGLTYPYLFWEGRGGMYQSPDKYWVVAEKDVPAFLTSTLAKLGLNEKETADFMEFWAPRMTGSPYYKIGFHGTNVMNQIAPMTISEKPNSILRILMDYVPLAKAEPSNPPLLPKTFVRNGFTVVEWGGVLR